MHTLCSLATVALYTPSQGTQQKVKMRKKEPERREEESNDFLSFQSIQHTSTHTERQDTMTKTVGGCGLGRLENSNASVTLKITQNSENLRKSETQPCVWK